MEEVPSWIDSKFFEDFVSREFKVIRNFNVKPAGKSGDNYTTLVLRVNFELELKDGKETIDESFIIKLLPTTPSTRDMVANWKIFEKEEITYCKYIPEFERLFAEAGKEVTFAAKYFKPQKLPSNEHIVVLEDLARRGFKNVKRQDGFDVVHTKAVLGKLAQFHAASAVYYERYGPYPSIYNRNLCPDVDQFVEYRENQGNTLIKSLPLYDAEYMTDTLKSYKSGNLKDQFQAHALKFDDEFQVLNHGDAWCNNIMFQYDDIGHINDTCFVDLQMNRYCSPAQDLIYMLLTSANIDIRVEKFDYFIRYYHEKLQENLLLLGYKKSIPTLRNLHKAIYNHSDWVYPIVTVVLPNILRDSIDKDHLDISDNDEQSRNRMFSSSRIIQQFKVLLPFAYHRGFFEYDKKYFQ